MVGQEVNTGSSIASSHIKRLVPDRAVRRRTYSDAPQGAAMLVQWEKVHSLGAAAGEPSSFSRIPGQEWRVPVSRPVLLLLEIGRDTSELQSQR